MPQQRYCPEILFPPYSYVTGQWPHPLNDSAGHSYEVSANSGSLHREPVTQNRYAVDLWNAGYYWEAHETWEALWNQAGRKGTTADLFKGLIKLAAAGVKAREGRTNGVERHLNRAIVLFNTITVEIDNVTIQEHRPCELVALAQQLRNAKIDPEVTKRVPVICVWLQKILLEIDPGI